MDERTCIRLQADHGKIRECRETLETHGKELDELARVNSLMGNPTRSKVLFLLVRGERLCVCDLADILDIGTPALSQHLRKLYDGGLILKEREGQTIYYRLSPDRAATVRAILHEVREEAMETPKPQDS